jgi:septal ring factor EnvC (AmiA/AmiB activator)
MTENTEIKELTEKIRQIKAEKKDLKKQIREAKKKIKLEQPEKDNVFKRLANHYKWLRLQAYKASHEKYLSLLEKSNQLSEEDKKKLTDEKLLRALDQQLDVILKAVQGKTE